MKDIKDKGVNHISLEKTKMGRPLYENYGFIQMTNEMELPRKEIVTTFAKID